MPAPFYNAINGTTAGTPGTGAFTPSVAVTGFRAWSTVPTGWIGLVRYEDGSAWELTYSYWNGTTLSRASTQLFDSSSGSAISLTSAATAAMIADASEIMSHLGTTPWRGWIAAPGNTTQTAIGASALSSTGTGAGVGFTNTSFLTMQPRVQYTSATTANAQAGVSSGSTNPVMVSATSTFGGWEMTARFGASAIPTGPRLWAGLTNATFGGNTGEPSALVGHYAVFACDSTDTNIQLLTNSGVGTGTKIDTGIPLAANGWYEISLWSEPGSTKINALLMRLDTGAIWLGSTTTDVPAVGNTMKPEIYGGLSGTTGTAIVMNIGSIVCRNGF